MFRLSAFYGRPVPWIHETQPSIHHLVEDARLNSYCVIRDENSSRPQDTMNWRDAHIAATLYDLERDNEKSKGLKRKRIGLRI